MRATRDTTAVKISVSLRRAGDVERSAAGLKHDLYALVKGAV